MLLLLLLLCLLRLLYLLCLHLLLLHKLLLVQLLLFAQLRLLCLLRLHLLLGQPLLLLFLLLLLRLLHCLLLFLYRLLLRLLLLVQLLLKSGHRLHRRSSLSRSHGPCGLRLGGRSIRCGGQSFPRTLLLLRCLGLVAATIVNTAGSPQLPAHCLHIIVPQIAIPKLVLARGDLTLLEPLFQKDAHQRFVRVREPRLALALALLLLLLLRLRTRL